jgi:hypothetical protein
LPIAPITEASVIRSIGQTNQWRIKKLKT